MLSAPSRSAAAAAYCDGALDLRVFESCQSVLGKQKHIQVSFFWKSELGNGCAGKWDNIAVGFGRFGLVTVLGFRVS